ncbi:MAG TPA: hypothetical protein VH592_20865 [Gemmataceae bacterium]
MSYLNLLFASAAQGILDNGGAGGVSPLSELRGLTPPAPGEVRSPYTGSGRNTDDYQLPSGIASLEHWLDLNA